MNSACTSSHPQRAKGASAPKAVERKSRERDPTGNFIETRRVPDWKQEGPALERRPAVFLRYAAD